MNHFDDLTSAPQYFKNAAATFSRERNPHSFGSGSLRRWRRPLKYQAILFEVVYYHRLTDVFHGG